MKKVFVLIDLSNDSFEFYKNTIFDFLHELKNIVIIDISRLINKFKSNKKYNCYTAKKFFSIYRNFKDKKYLFYVCDYK